MGWSNRLRRIISGAHSSTGGWAEQTEYYRKTVSVEIVVETHEVILKASVDTISDSALVERRHAVVRSGLDPESEIK